MALGLSSAVVVGVRNLGGLGPRHFQAVRFLRFPPTWLAGLVGTAVYLLLTSLVGGSTPNAPVVPADVILAVVFLGGGAVVYLGCSSILTREKSAPRAVPGAQGIGFSSLEDLAANPDRILPWVEREAAIEWPDEDLFGHVRIARRVTGVLCRSPIQTVGIIGPYGCGKTSILKLIAYYLGADQRLSQGERSRTGTVPRTDGRGCAILSCSVGAWGLREGAIAERVLTTVLNELQRHVDCTSLVTLPSRYRAALAAGGGRWGALLGELFSQRDDPAGVLRKLDPVLEAIGFRLVVFIEDLDRNPEALGADLPALLDRLRELRQVSFVLALSAEGLPAPMARICSHVEVVPHVPADDVLDILKGFRKMCLQQHPFIDPLGSGREKLLGEPDPYVRRMVRKIAAGMGRITTEGSVAALLAVPRALKATLRRAHRAWEQLHGEIDFDDMLVATAVRVAAPEAYDFILRNLEHLRVHRNTTKDEKALEAEVESLWDRTAAHVGWDAPAAKQLVRFLFPAWKEDPSITDDYSDPRIRPQGVARSTPTDYFVRLNAEEIDPEELRDQTALRAIENWKKDHRAPVFEGKTLEQGIFASEPLCAKLEQFQRYFDGREVRVLAEAVLKMILDTDGVEANGDHHGFLPLWRMSLDLPIPLEDHEQWLTGEIEKAFPVSLRFANDLLYYWSKTDRSLTGGEVRIPPTAHQAAITTAQRVFQGAPDRLLGALSRLHPYSLRHFIVLYSGPGFDPSTWSWIAGPLIQAGMKAPAVVLPQLACLFVDAQRRRSGEISYAFRLDWAEGMFACKLGQLMQVLSSDVGLEKYEEVVSGFVLEAQRAAREWLAKNPQPNSPASETEA
jgi:hypothetical protein